MSDLIDRQAAIDAIDESLLDKSIQKGIAIEILLSNRRGRGTGTKTLKVR